MDALRCRLAIRIRANPSNRHTLHRLSVLDVVPPQFNGEHNVQIGNGSSSNDNNYNDNNNDNDNNNCGAVWDEMKRTLAYSCNQLPPGEMVDWQAIFPREEGHDYNSNNNNTALFPIMLQCHGHDHLFSRLEVTARTYEQPARPMSLNTTLRTSVLFRKVS